ncbi:MAG: ComEC/Rec2 family competence protein [Patescibacteria group bacterium]
MEVRDKILAICIGGFITGVLVRSFVDFSIYFSCFFLVIGLALFLQAKFENGQSGFRRFSLGLFILATGLGMLRFDVSEFKTTNPILENHLSERVTLTGTIVDEPDERADSNRLTVKLENFLTGDVATPIFSKALLVADLYPQFQYGDAVEFSGQLEKPKNFADPSGKIFDYQNYLAKEGIYYQVNRPKITLIKSDQGNFVVSKLFDLKHAFLNQISKLIPEPDASLLGGLVVGAKHALGQNLLDDFRRAGVIHIVVLSGYNITIVAESIIGFFSFLPKYLGQSFGALGIILFAIMTGGSATVVRSSLMALLVIVARTTGRQYNITRALLFAGLFMVFQNPKILVFDSSFQLSFASTLALIYVSPIFEKRFLFVTEKFGLRAILVSTLSTQIFVLPMLLYKMGQLSLVALPVNILILSAIPATMLFGFLAGVIGFISSVLAFPFATVAYGLLEYELRVVEFFAHLPFSSVAIAGFPLWLAVFAYLVYLWGIVFLSKKTTGKKPRDLLS